MRLLRNRRFQQLFLDETERQLEGTLRPENVRSHIRRLHDRIAPDVIEDLQRSFSDIVDDGLWKSAIADLETFADRRPAVMREMIFHSPRLASPRQTSRP